MLNLKTEQSELVNFYEEKTILITGATGFLGKVLLEKLLRTCNSLNKIYIILRAKKGKDAKERLHDMWKLPMFDLVKKVQPDAFKKISVIHGDLFLPNMGFSSSDEEKLINEVNIVFHCAATTRFDEHLRKSTIINVLTVKDLLNLAERMKHLKAFVHVSTAYSNCNRSEINEKSHRSHMSPDKLINLVELVDDDSLSAMTPAILKDHPNTYTFTKQVAEQLVVEKHKVLPVGILRPSIVISAINEPCPGWIDNMFGPIAASIGIAVGLVRCLPMKTEKLLDIVPVDMTINCIITFAWDISNNINARKNDNIPICNYVSSPQKPLTSGEYVDLAFVHFRHWPSILCAWWAMLVCARNMFQYRLFSFFLHTIPAYLVDLVLLCLGKKPLLVGVYKKIEKFMSVYCYFMFNEWKFTNDNVVNLWDKLNETDRKLFSFSMEKIVWPEYFEIIGMGGRLYILKDPIETLEKARLRFKFLKAGHYTLLLLLCYGLYKLFTGLLGFVFTYCI